MPSADTRPALRHALALGLLQGPTELLPVSSSAHTVLVPWLLGWPHSRLDDERRKTFEVALHAGAGAALTIHMRPQLTARLRGADARRLRAMALSLAPPVACGFALRAPIERLFGGPRSAALGLAVGAAAMALADSTASQARTCAEVDERDGLALGLAQTCALMPGVSRNGATLTAARARGFDRESAQALSWTVALPVILGASALKAARLRRAGLGPGEGASLALGGASAFVSTLLSSRVAGRALHGRRLWPFAVYRCLLAFAVVRRLAGAE